MQVGLAVALFGGGLWAAKLRACCCGPPVPVAVGGAGASWGPEQAVGLPNTRQAADSATAWASLNPDGADEWLELGYKNPAVPKAVLIYENCCPGAVVRVTVFKADGSEVEAWRGKDPTPASAGKGISAIPIKVDFKVARVKVYLDSAAVPGWNEIDAVGLFDVGGTTQWASSAKASSTYATAVAPIPVAPVPVAPPVAPPAEVDARVRKLEQEVRDLRRAVEDLKSLLQEKDQKSAKPPGPRPAKPLTNHVEPKQG
jgi:hypothetical protein